MPPRAQPLNALPRPGKILILTLIFRHAPNLAILMEEQIVLGSMPLIPLYLSPCPWIDSGDFILSGKRVAYPI